MGHDQQDSRVRGELGVEFLEPADERSGFSLHPLVGLERVEVEGPGQVG
jgi:hypothetical protein